MDPTLLFVAYLSIAFVIAGRGGVSRSRRALAVAIASMLPIIGLPLAILVRRVRGAGYGAEPLLGEAPLRELRPDEVLSLADQPCALDRLTSFLPEERLDALVALASASDANAISLLRWTVQYGARESMLEAALTLEELDLQRVRLVEDAARAFEANPCSTTAMAAGDAALAGILNGLADRAILPSLARRAREWFEYAVQADPSCKTDVVSRLFLLDEDPRCAV